MKLVWSNPDRIRYVGRVELIRGLVKEDRKLYTIPLNDGSKAIWMVTSKRYRKEIAA